MRNPCWYTPESTWVDGLIAVLIADRECEYRSDSYTEIEMNTEQAIWYQLRKKVDWEEALRWSPKWHEYGYAE